jgi:hypothetical protein
LRIEIAPRFGRETFPQSAERRRMNRERPRTGATAIRQWRSAAGAAGLVTFIFAFAVLGSRNGHPVPRLEHLMRVHGTVERMRIIRADGGCRPMTLRIDTPSGRMRAGNRDLCGAMRGVAPLPPGAPVTLLIERIGRENLVWEMASGDRRYIRYEQMRAVRLRQQRAYRVTSKLLAAACLPFVLIIAVWLWKELSWFIRRALAGHGRIGPGRA